ncbi:Holliday junction branch migration protein RuvA [Nitrospira moscoviensis]|uniref:Holliday junction branch migration complex subunit RuvA n=1 Tax=Nitrospira moscoviensis TaxID=42253 RepID=A0A0K2G854_NITMO|nr:Holliday junction branch migration protein RuvA [Nitrospira moscoviensis]ALA56787.1 Holliday junction ATP-dependent DNA helicase RuvA [Nitrospira moscoviensis]
MIAFLTGRLAFKSPTHLTLDVQGVGYEVHIPLSTYYALPNLDETTALNIHTHLREDAIQLFGFLSQAEKESFLLLTTVSGIGPKLALSVLSSLSVTDLLSAIQSEDVDKLSTVPGIGKKSAGRIALELKDKVGKIHLPGASRAVADQSDLGGPYEDAWSALVNLGYRPQDARDALKRVSKKSNGPVVLQELIREGLKELTRG